MAFLGFTSWLRIMKINCGAGFDQEGKRFSSASMKLEGKLLDIDYANMRQRMKNGIETSVHVDVELTEKQEIPFECEDEERNYIGTIQLYEEKDAFDHPKISVIVRINLPLKMLSELFIMEDKYIKFYTIHDIIENPTSEQMEDHVVAFVKRAHFEMINEFSEEFIKKTCDFGRG